MSVRSLSESPGDYENVILPDGTQILRERQTKAQARIQALIAKSRNMKLRESLILLSDNEDKGAEFRIPEDIVQKDITQEIQPAINHQITASENILPLNEDSYPAATIDTNCVVETSSSVTTVNECSAIQRQIMLNLEKTTHREELTNSSTKDQDKVTEFNAFSFKKRIFEPLINQEIVQFLTHQKIKQRV